MTVAPVSNDADVNAMMVPTKVVVVPRVAELPTCQNTLQGCAPSMRLTVLFRCGGERGPCLEDEDRVGIALTVEREGAGQGEGGFFVHARCQRLSTEVGGLDGERCPAAASRYAVVRSLWAWAATVSVAWMVPGGTKTPGGNPVIAGSGTDADVPKDCRGPRVGHGLATEYGERCHRTESDGRLGGPGG